MAINISHDLTTIYSDNLDASWSELSGWGAGADPINDTEAFIQGSSCESQQIATAKTGIASGMDFDAGADITAFTDNTDLFFFWWLFLFPQALNPYSEALSQTPAVNAPGTASGYFIGVGSADNAMKWFAVGGSNYGRYPFGGWQNVAIDPTRTANWTEGTPAASNYRFFGFLPNVISAPARGQSNVADAIRWGRGTITVSGGTPDITFDDIASFNDSTQARLGLFQSTAGGYLWKGSLVLGTAGAPITFTDANKNINLDDTRQVYKTFNQITINNASSTITWDNINFTKLRYISTLPFDSSRGIFTVNNGAVLNATNGSFTDFGIFNLDSNVTFNGTTFRRCNFVNQLGATLTECSFVNSTDSVAAVYVSGTNAADLNNITNSFWEKTAAGPGHGLWLGTITSSVTRSWDGNDYTGYQIGVIDSAVGLSGTDSAVILVSVNSGVTLTLNLVNGATKPSFKNTGAGSVVLSAAVTVTLTGMFDGTEVRIYETNTITEIAGVEDLTGGVGTGLSNGTAGGTTNDNSFSFTTSQGDILDIRLFNIDFESDPILGYVVPAGGASIPIAQRTDRVYDNP